MLIDFMYFSNTIRGKIWSGKIYKYNEITEDLPVDLPTICLISNNFAKCTPSKFFPHTVFKHPKCIRLFFFTECVKFQGSKVLQFYEQLRVKTFTIYSTL